MLLLSDSFFDDIITFLQGCETHGGSISANLGGANENGQQSAEALLAASAEQPSAKDIPPRHLHTVAYEARLLLRLFIKLRE